MGKLVPATEVNLVIEDLDGLELRPDEITSLKIAQLLLVINAWFC